MDQARSRPPGGTPPPPPLLPFPPPPPPVGRSLLTRIPPPLSEGLRSGEDACGWSLPPLDGEEGEADLLGGAPVEPLRSLDFFFLAEASPDDNYLGGLAIVHLMTMENRRVFLN